MAKRRPAQSPVRKLRSHLGITQIEFCEELGDAVSQGHISAAESGLPLGRTTTLAIVDQFRSDMQHVDVTVEDLLRGKRRRGR